MLWGPGRNRKVNRGQNQLTMYIFSISVLLAGSSCQNHQVKRGQNQLTLFIFSNPVVLVGSKLMSCVLAELVSNPQGEPGSKPAHNVHFFIPGSLAWRCSGGLVSKPRGHNAHFLNSGVIGLELMSGALGASCRNHKVNRAQNHVTMHIFSIPGSLVGSSCHVL